MIPRTEAIVLKSFDYRETSKIVTFYTKDRGKITGVMKGVRKDPRKFGSSVDKYSINDFQVPPPCHDTGVAQYPRISKNDPKLLLDGSRIDPNNNKPIIRNSSTTKTF